MRVIATLKIYNSDILPYKTFYSIKNSYKNKSIKKLYQIFFPALVISLSSTLLNLDY